jgi:hypothetical protein
VTSAAVPDPQGEWKGGVPTHSEEPDPALPLAELDLLERAQRILTRDPRRALELLTRHRAAYPAGELSQERDVLLLDALARLRMSSELQARGRAFLQRWPASPHRARVVALLRDAAF